MDVRDGLVDSALPLLLLYRRQTAFFATKIVYVFLTIKRLVLLQQGYLRVLLCQQLLVLQELLVLQLRQLDCVSVQHLLHLGLRVPGKRYRLPIDPYRLAGGRAIHVLILLLFL